MTTPNSSAPPVSTRCASSSTAMPSGSLKPWPRPTRSASWCSSCRPRKRCSAGSSTPKNCRPRSATINAPRRFGDAGRCHTLHLAPLAGRGRFASGALAKRSKSGEGAFPQAQPRGHAPSPDLLRFARKSTSPRTRQGCPGNDSLCHGACSAQPAQTGPFRLSRLRKEPSMRFRGSIFGRLLEPINRRQFQAAVDRLDADAYDKSFKSWDHLVALIYAQLSGASGLRGLIAGFNANAHHHYHLGVGELARSTLGDANARRPTAVFAQTLAMLVEQADRRTRQEGSAMVRLIDASPIPLGEVCKWTRWNGRCRGMKMHVVYDPTTDVPHCIEITPANINDVEVGRQVRIEPGMTYVYDKGYCRFDWWRKINDSRAFFVTRPKANMRLRAARYRSVRKRAGDGFTIIDDAEVRLVSKGDSRLPIPLRRIRVRRDKGGSITLLTNDLERTAVEIAALYKSRWQIELLFRWIKQHLSIRKFLGNNENAIRLQILAAMIAYLLLRIAARVHCITMLPIRLAQLVSQLLFSRRTITQIGKPTPVNPSNRKQRKCPDQMEFCYA